jgi:predicted ATP-binding protein involved in virulence
MENFKLSTKIFNPINKFSLNLKEMLIKNINIYVGVNGSGKSLILSCIWACNEVLFHSSLVQNRSDELNKDLVLSVFKNTINLGDFENFEFDYVGDKGSRLNFKFFEW